MWTPWVAWQQTIVLSGGEIMRRTIIAGAAAVLSLGLVACGSDDDTPDDQATVQPGGETTPPATPPATSDTGAATPTTPTMPAGDVHESVTRALVALATAEREAGGTAFDLEEEGNEGWDIDVAVGDRVVELTVSPDGTRVTETDDDNDTLDSEDRSRLAQATVPIAEALTTAAGQAEGRLESIELDSFRGTTVWEIEFESGSGDTEVRIDVTTGGVVNVTRD